MYGTTMMMMMMMMNTFQLEYILGRDNSKEEFGNDACFFQSLRQTSRRGNTKRNCETAANDDASDVCIFDPQINKWISSAMKFMKKNESTRFLDDNNSGS